MLHKRHFFPLAFFLATLILIFVVASPSTAQDSTFGGPTFAQRVLEIVNEERWQNGHLPPLKGESTLNSAAETHSNNMAVRNFFDHCDLDTHTSPWDRMEAAGYTNWNYAGENIAAGYGSPENVMAGWMNSSGHRANILSTEFREIGIGFINQDPDQNNVRSDNDGDCEADTANGGPYTNYWTQNFGRRNEIMPVVINREAYETAVRDVNLYLYGTGWAQSMRFRNSEAENWSAWYPFAADTVWTLSCGNGDKTVYSEINSGSNGSGVTRSAQDAILLNSGDGSLSVAPGTLSFVAYPGHDPNLPAHTVIIENMGGTATDWHITENPTADWLSVSATTGQLSPCDQDELNVTVSLKGLTPGVYNTMLVVTDDESNESWQIPVRLLVTELSPIYLPTILKP